MHRRTRSLIFFIFLAIFVIGAPVIVLYTAGYRLNTTTWHVQRTGVIAFSTFPRGATVLLNGILVSERTPYVAQRLTPGNYTVQLSKNGYHLWNQRVSVNSGSTAYISALLFSDTLPTLLLEDSALSVTADGSGRFIDTLVPSPQGEGREIWRYDTVTRLQHKIASVSSLVTEIRLSHDESALLLTGDPATPAISTNDGHVLSKVDAALAANLVPEYTFFDNGSNVEMRHADTDALITLLPSSVYTPVLRTSSLVVLRDSRHRAYLVDLPSSSVTQVDIPSDIVVAAGSDNLLASTDGNEIDISSPQTGEKTFITRQSDPIIALAWHSSDQALLFATASKIVAIEREKYETRTTTTLLENASIVNMWPDTTGKNIIFFGTVKGITGIWTLPLQQ